MLNSHSYWKLYALFLENSKLITFTKSWTKNTHTTIKNPPTKIKNDVFVSKYDKLSTFLNEGKCLGIIASILGNFYIEDKLNGRGFKIGRITREQSVPLLKIFDNVIHCGDVTRYRDLQIGDITVDNKCLMLLQTLR
jgi:hypothetical protein